MSEVKRCPVCFAVWEFDDWEVILMPWPHYECPDCGTWIPAF